MKYEEENLNLCKKILITVEQYNVFNHQCFKLKKRIYIYYICKQFFINEKNKR